MNEFVSIRKVVRPKPYWPDRLLHPWLELLSALLLARLITTVSANLKLILPPFDLKCYTDSLVIFYWIQGTEKDWKPFVKNRVVEIRSHVSPENWRHCPGLSNPADLPSHGLTLLELSVSQLWQSIWHVQNPSSTQEVRWCESYPDPQQAWKWITACLRAFYELEDVGSDTKWNTEGALLHTLTLSKLGWL